MKRSKIKFKIENLIQKNAFIILHFSFLSLNL